jgi:hypothetical protein
MSPTSYQAAPPRVKDVKYNPMSEERQPPKDPFVVLLGTRAMSPRRLSEYGTISSHKRTQPSDDGRKG